MLFGLIKAPAVFQALVNDVLRDLLNCSGEKMRMLSKYAKTDRAPSMSCSSGVTAPPGAPVVCEDKV